LFIQESGSVIEVFAEFIVYLHVLELVDYLF